MIYHVTTNQAWEHALQQGSYQPDSLATEGFIHNSTLEQLPGVLDRYYKDQQGLIVLHIDETLLTSVLKYELAPSVNEKFPHVFGPVNLNAVINTREL